jgi:hypothetical protein
MEQVVDTVVHVAEDIMAGGDPNLAKVLHKAYRKEREEEARSRGTTPHFVSIDEGIVSKCTYYYYYYTLYQLNLK